MKNFLRSSLLVWLLLLPVLALAAQRRPPADSPLGGQWKGILRMPGTSCEVSITVVPLTNGTLYATLDMPKRGISRMPVQMTVKGMDVSMRIEQAASRFTGKLSADKRKMSGTWNQPGLSTALVLQLPPASPATAKFDMPAPYREEEVVVPNKIDRLRLNGTLTMPHGKGPFPAVVLISDSGPQDRNVVVDNYRMFNILADYLTRRGVAVLRYDDRGVGKSSGNYQMATTADLVSDAQAAMGFLRAHYKIDKKSVGMIGHGEGANVALLAGSQFNPPSFVVSLAGYGLSGSELLKRQQVDIMRLIGANTMQVESALKLHQQMLNIIRQTPDDKLAKAKVAAMLRMSNSDIDFTMVQARAAQLTSPWYRYFIDFDPKAKLGNVKCPVLALNGTADFMVTANKNLPVLQKGLKAKGNRNVMVYKLPGVNHWFQTDQAQWPIVNGQIQPTFSPKALVMIHGWVAKHTATAQVPAKAAPAAKVALGGGANSNSKRAAR